MELDQQLSELAKHAARLKSQLAREEGQLETLREQRDKIIAVCKERGVDPESREKVIQQKRQELTTLLSVIDSSLTEIEEKRGEVFGTIGVETKA